MNKTELDKCLEFIEKYIKEENSDVYRNSLDMARLYFPEEKDPKGTVSTIIKVLDGKTPFTLSYMNFEIDNETVYQVDFNYGNTEIKNSTFSLFENIWLTQI